MVILEKSPNAQKSAKGKLRCASGIIPFLLRQEWLQLKNGIPKVVRRLQVPEASGGKVASLVSNVKTLSLGAKPKEVPAEFDTARQANNNLTFGWTANGVDFQVHVLAGARPYLLLAVGRFAISGFLPTPVSVTIALHGCCRMQ